MIQSAVILAGRSPAKKSQLMQGLSRTMLPALGKPMIARVMDQLYRTGIRHFIVIVGMNDGEVASYLNAHWVPDAKVDFLMRGMGESFLQQLSGIAKRIDAPFLMTGYNTFVYDTFIETLIKRHSEDAEALILSAARNMLSESSSQHFASVSDEYMQDIGTTHSDTHPYILNELSICGTHFIDFLKNTTGQSSDDYFAIIQTYLQNMGKIRMAEASWILQVETDTDVLKLNRQLLGNSNDAHILSELPRTVKIVPPVRIDPQVSVGQNATIGPYVYLEKGTRIGEGAQIDNAVVLKRAYVPPHSHISNVLLTHKGTVSG